MARELLIYERFVNRMGIPGHNMPFDLDVEHLNKVFKERFTLHRGEPTDAMMYRVSASQDVTTDIIHVHTDSWQSRAGPRAARRQNQDVYKADVAILASTLREEAVEKVQSGRRLRCDKLNKAAYDPLLSLDVYALRTWYAAKTSAMATMPHFHH